MVVRIMVMVPLYAIASLISIFSLEAAFFIDAVRDIYEVRTLSSAQLASLGLRTIYSECNVAAGQLQPEHTLCICQRLPETLRDLRFYVSLD